MTAVEGRDRKEVWEQEEVQSSEQTPRPPPQTPEGALKLEMASLRYAVRMWAAPGKAALGKVAVCSGCNSGMGGQPKDCLPAAFPTSGEKVPA